MSLGPAAGVPAVRQPLAGAAAPAAGVWQQRRRGHPLHGGGHRGHRAVLDQPGQPQGLVFLGFEKGRHWVQLCAMIGGK